MRALTRMSIATATGGRKRPAPSAPTQTNLFRLCPPLYNTRLITTSSVQTGRSPSAVPFASPSHQTLRGRDALCSEIAATSGPRSNKSHSTCHREIVHWVWGEGKCLGESPHPALVPSLGKQPRPSPEEESVTSPPIEDIQDHLGVLLVLGDDLFQSKLGPGADSEVTTYQTDGNRA